MLEVIVTIMTIMWGFICSANVSVTITWRSICIANSYCDNNGEVYIQC